MSASIKNINFQVYFFLTVIFLFNNICSAQDTSKIESSIVPEKAEIQWLSQWPSPESKQQKKEVKQHIKDFIFGKKKEGLSRPVSVLAQNQNSFWVLDQQNNAILQVCDKICKNPRFIEKKNTGFSSLVGICKFRENEMLFTDSYSNKIFLINSEKKECRILNDSLKLNKITGIAYSALENEIWVIETGEHRIVILNEKGEIKKTIGSRGSGKGQFNFPTHIWIDRKGNIYVVDAMNFRVQVLNKNGVVISVFGSNGDATGYFACPKGIATDSYGDIYVVDALFHAVQVFDVQGNFLYTFGTQGHDEGQFWIPSGIFIDENDKIYIADSYNSRIQVFQLITGGKK